MLKSTSHMVKWSLHSQHLCLSIFIKTLNLKFSYILHTGYYLFQCNTITTAENQVKSTSVVCVWASRQNYFFCAEICVCVYIYVIIHFFSPARCMVFLGLRIHCFRRLWRCCQSISALCDIGTRCMYFSTSDSDGLSKSNKDVFIINKQSNNEKLV